MFLRAPRTIEHVMHKRRVEMAFDGMVQHLGEGTQDREIGGTLDIENPSPLLSLVILIKANFLQGLQYLGAAIIDAVRSSADERDDHVAVGGLVENNLRMTRDDNLASAFRRGVGEKLINLPLPQYFEMGVRFVEKKDGFGIDRHMGQQEKCLLESASR